MVEKYFAMVWRRKKRKDSPQDLGLISFFYPATFFLSLLPLLPPRFSFFVIVALIALMAQFCFRFSTLFAASIPHKSIFLGCTIA